MNITLKKSLMGAFLLLSTIALFMLSAQTATAQTDPEGTPVNGYPPPATPAQPEEAYPGEQPILPNPTPTDGAYIPPTQVVPATNPPTIIGDEAPAATVVPTLPVSQSAIVRNRAILWAGFLITLLLFFIAVYGAMLMYTRQRNS